MMKIKRTDKQIDEVLNKCAELFDQGINPWPGETYASGVQNAILWMIGQVNDDPMDE